MMTENLLKAVSIVDPQDSLHLIMISTDWHYKLRFQQSVVDHAHDILLNAETPQYEVILNLDRQLRQITVPNAKLFPKPSDQEYRNAGLCMQGCLMSQIRSIGEPQHP